METARKIQVRRRGNALGLWIFRRTVGFLGLEAGYGLLYFVCLHYLMFDREAVRGASAYVRRRFPGAGPVSRLLHVYRLFVSQGKQLIDRYAAVTGDVGFVFDVVGEELLESVVKKGERGVVLLTAHVGNWQVAMRMVGNLEKDVYLVMRPEDNEAVRNTLRFGSDGKRAKIISPESHLGGIVEIMNALRAGHIVSIMGDRAYGFESVRVDFMGASAKFPYSAFKIAAAAQCPVVLLLSAKEAGMRYVVDLSHCFEPLYRGRRRQEEWLREWVQAYADVLSEYVQKYPYQCFLFHDVWQDAGDVPSRPSVVEETTQAC